MSRSAQAFLLIFAPALAVFLGCIGYSTLQENILGWFLLLLGIGYPAGGIAYYWVKRKPFWRPANPEEVVFEESGDRSFWFILPGFLVIFFAPPLEYLFIPANLSLPRSFGMQLAGILLIAAAGALRLWALRHIKGFYSGGISVREGHVLVQTGPYRWIRHPGYTGFMLVGLGVCLGYSSLIGLLSLPALLLPGMIYRVKVEENLLEKFFGEEYRSYAMRTKRIIPGIW